MTRYLNDALRLMHLYRFARVTVASELELPELPDAGRAESGPADLVLRYEASNDTPRIDWERRSRSLFDSRPTAPDGTTPRPDLDLDVRRRDDGWVLEFATVLRCHLANDRRTLVCAAAEGASAASVSHVILDQVLPYVLALRGEIVLHASAVVIDGGGIAFLGPSGMGKSTLATSLGQEGHDVLTDDCAVVRWVDTAPVVEPSYPGLRLWSESVDHLLADDDGKRHPMAHYTPKLRTMPAALRFADKGAPLRGVLVIGNPPDDDPGQVTITRLGGAAATFALGDGAFVLADGPGDTAANFDRFTRLANAVPVARITVPNDFSRLPAVREAVVAWAVSLSQPPARSGG
jgi:hypothetical protein